MMITDKEKALIRRLQAEIPVEKRPFAIIGRLIGLNEEDVLACIRQWKAQGLIRKMTAIVRHQKVGFKQNAMALWAVSPEDCETAGQKLASFPEVSHCYERTPPFEGKYNLFTMVHSREEPLEKLILRLSALSGINDFKILMSEEELKKSSMVYF